MTNYSTLVADVLKTLERENDPVAQGLIDTWIRLTEQELAPTLKAPWAERVAQFDYNPVDRFAYLPPSYSGMIAVIDMTSGLPLDPITPLEIAQTVAATAPNQPVCYCVMGYTLALVPPPADARTMWLVYHSKQEPLSSSEPVNDITANAYGLYYYGVLRHAAVYYGEVNNLNTWNAAFDQQLTNANGSSTAWRRGASAPEWRGP